MVKYRYIQACIICLLVLAETAQAITLTDDRGHTLSIEHYPQRIVSLAPHITEMLFAIGAGNRIVGADEFSDYPAAAAQIPRIGSASRIDIERVIALNPDIVIGWQSGNAPSDIAKLENLGVPVYITEITSLDNIADQLANLGRLIGASDAAKLAATEFQQQLAQLRENNAGKLRVTVFYQVWDRPLMTVNGRHFISNAINLCGGTSLFREMEPLAPTISKEAVIAANPQVIISGKSGSDGASLESMWGDWKSLDAVKYGNLFVIPADLIARPVPRILDGVKMMCEKLDQARINMSK
jgi:iron complex transport system substrate-binding protein